MIEDILYYESVVATEYTLLEDHVDSINHYSDEDFLAIFSVTLEVERENVFAKYFEKAWVFATNIVNKIMTLIKRIWLKTKVMFLKTYNVEELEAKLKKYIIEGKKLVIGKRIKKIIKNNISYFYNNIHVHIKGKIIKDRTENMIAGSRELRSAMLKNGKPKIDLNVNLTFKDISNTYKIPENVNRYKDKIVYLSSYGNYIYVLAKLREDKVLTSNYSILKLQTKLKMPPWFFKSLRKDDVVKIGNKLVDLKFVYELLKDLPTGKELYDTITNKLFHEIQEIESNLKSLRSEKIASKETAQSKVELVKQVTGFSKALMYIGNGMINEYKTITNLAITTLNVIEGGE